MKERVRGGPVANPYAQKHKKEKTLGLEKARLGIKGNNHNRGGEHEGT